MSDQEQHPKESRHPPYEEIRSRLRALGYLNSPVERFLSRPAGGPWKTGFLVTVKVSLLVGLLLAGLTTASTLFADPSFIENSRDVFLFFFYLGSAYSLTAFCLALLPTFLWVRKGKKSMGLRREGTLRSVILSVVTAVILCAYLLGWWHIVVFESYLIRPMGILSLAVLVAIALVSLMAGRLVGFVYFLLAGVPEYPRSRRSPVSRSFIFSLSLVLLIEGAWTIGILRYRSADNSLASVLQKYSVRPLPMLLVGLDGLDFKSLLQLTAEGSLPNLARLIKGGVTAELATQKNYLAPQVWTTAATGVKPELHGINHFVLPVLRGLSRQPRLGSTRPGFDAILANLFPFFRLVRSVPVSASSRLSKTIWEIIELFDMPVGVVNWWASWPAMPVKGFTVSERTFRKITSIPRDQAPSAYYETEVFPPAEFDSLVILCDKLVKPFNQELAEYPKIYDLLENTLPEKAYDLVRSVYFADYFYTQAAIELARRQQVVFLALYLQGADILSRLEERTDLVSSASLHGAIPEYYRYMDRLLGELIQEFQPSGLLVVVCDPGKNGRDRDLKGAVIFNGIDVKKGSSTEQAVPLEDVAPTMLYLIGLPVARNMGGSPHLEAGIPGPGGAGPLSFVTSYGPPPPTREPSIPYRHDREEIERLRRLGYIK
ncbi:MAG TPA: alkaline phosphatase family protein [archaeon]|nr:alkaline phosphatase family protein [archaeon]